MHVGTGLRTPWLLVVQKEELVPEEYRLGEVIRHIFLVRDDKIHVTLLHHITDALDGERRFCRDICRSSLQDWTQKKPKLSLFGTSLCECGTNEEGWINAFPVKTQ